MVHFITWLIFFNLYFAYDNHNKLYFYLLYWYKLQLQRYNLIQFMCYIFSLLCPSYLQSCKCALYQSYLLFYCSENNFPKADYSWNVSLYMVSYHLQTYPWISIPVHFYFYQVAHQQQIHPYNDLIHHLSWTTLTHTSNIHFWCFPNWYSHFSF